MKNNISFIFIILSLRFNYPVSPNNKSLCQVNQEITPLEANPEFQHTFCKEVIY